MKRKIVEGSVVDRNGRPVAGAFVTIEATAPHSDIAGVTTSEGKFRLEMPAGDFSVRAVTRSGMSGAKQISKFNHNKFSPIINLS